MATNITLVDDKRGSAIVLSPMARAMYGFDKTTLPVIHEGEEYDIFETIPSIVPTKESLPLIIRMIIEHDNNLKMLPMDQVLADIPYTETYAQIYNNIVAAVVSSASPSRFFATCSITGIKDEENLIGRVYTGAKSIIDQYYLVTIQFLKSVDFLFPVADIYYNLYNYIVPLNVCPFFQTYQSKYMIIFIKRSNGAFQKAFFETNTMITYRVLEEDVYMNPNMSTDPTNMVALLPVFFDMNTQGDLIENGEYPTVKGQIGTKKIKIYDIIDLNPHLKNIFMFEQDMIPNFHRAILKTMSDLVKKNTLDV